FTSARAQPNLIFNPSFEQIDTCLGGYLGFSSFNFYGWYSSATADLYTDCQFSNFYVPNNRLGFQYPVSGSNYAGIGTYCRRIPLCEEWKEYLTGQIIEPLKTGKTYCGSMYVSFADTMSVVCNDMGIAFTNFVPTNPSGANLNINPQIENNIVNNPLANKINWTEVKGNFVANGTEQYITIGNFIPSLLSDTIETNFN
ncbi:MAG: hypothetical protein LC111_14505, partial [Bacteroidia bacterium]|nr:hypothetical protein [Bacteroidia bacterium]